jgi:phenylacetic acid degradation operon negative regulatory protein
VSAILDDMDSRPGSATSLLRTVVGLYLRRIGGWISIVGLIELMEQVGAPATATRTAVARLKKKELLLPRAVDRVAGYEVNPAAERMLAKGDRRIFSTRSMGPDDAWCLISFSIPEENRHLRHQLRRRLRWIGCGMVSSALWICPDYLREEVGDILADLELLGRTTLFRTERPMVAGELAAAVAEWWDLDALAALHRGVLVELDGLLAGPVAGESEAFGRYVRGVDAWRVIPYLDPGLPADLLPADWPGTESARRFAELTVKFRDAGWEYVAHKSFP